MPNTQNNTFCSSAAKCCTDVKKHGKSASDEKRHFRVDGDIFVSESATSALSGSGANTHSAANTEKNACLLVNGNGGAGGAPGGGVSCACSGSSNITITPGGGSGTPSPSPAPAPAPQPSTGANAQHLLEITYCDHCQGIITAAA